MGKFNEIQEETTQSWGSNSFTTTVKEDTVEFDSAKDKFTFKDEVEVPSLKVNGEQVSSQVQADWNQNDSEAADYIKNRICYSENSIETLFDDTITYTIHQANLSGGMVELSDPFQFTEGKQYTVTKDGTEYILTAQIVGSGRVPALVYGNFGEYENGSWMIGIYGSQLAMQECAETQLVSTTLKIVGAKETVNKIDEKFIPEKFYNLNTSVSSETATVIKPNTFATEIFLNSDDEFVFDFSSLNNNAAQAFGYFDANFSTPSSISFVDTNGDSISSASNITEFESAEYMCTFMMLNYSGENRVFATFTKMQ